MHHMLLSIRSKSYIATILGISNYFITSTVILLCNVLMFVTHNPNTVCGTY